MAIDAADELLSQVGADFVTPHSPEVKLDQPKMRLLITRPKPDADVLAQTTAR